MRRWATFARIVAVKRRGIRKLTIWYFLQSRTWTWSTLIDKHSSLFVYLLYKCYHTLIGSWLARRHLLLVLDVKQIYVLMVLNLFKLVFGGFQTFTWADNCYLEWTSRRIFNNTINIADVLLRKIAWTIEFWRLDEKRECSWSRN